MSCYISTLTREVDHWQDGIQGSTISIDVFNGRKRQNCANRLYEAVSWTEPVRVDDWILDDLYVYVDLEDMLVTIDIQYNDPPPELGAKIKNFIGPLSYGTKFDDRVYCNDEVMMDYAENKKADDLIPDELQICFNGSNTKTCIVVEIICHEAERIWWIFNLTEVVKLGDMEISCLRIKSYMNDDIYVSYILSSNIKCFLEKPYVIEEETLETNFHYTRYCRRGIENFWLSEKFCEKFRKMINPPRRKTV